MANQYIIVCDKQGNYIDGRHVGTSDEINLKDFALVIQAAIWQGWDIKLTTEIPVVDFDNGPIQTWLRHTNQTSPKLLEEWRVLDSEVLALREQNNNLLADNLDLSTKNSELQRKNNELLAPIKITENNENGTV